MLENQAQSNISDLHEKKKFKSSFSSHQAECQIKCKNVFRKTHVRKVTKKTKKIVENSFFFKIEMDCFNWNEMFIIQIIFFDYMIFFLMKTKFFFKQKGL